MIIMTIYSENQDVPEIVVWRKAEVLDVLASSGHSARKTKLTATILLLHKR